MGRLAALFPRTDAAPPSVDARLGASNVAPAEYCALRYAGKWTGPIPDQGQQMVAAIWTLVALATVFMALRFYCKIWRLRKLWWDDWVLFMSWVCPPTLSF